MKGLRVPKTPPPWREVMATADQDAWYPLIFDRGDPAQAAVMEELMAASEVMFVHDTIDAQLADLVKTRNPPANLTPEQIAERIEAQLGGRTAQDYGRWAFFPWSRRLVHLLPPAEFAEVRSDRNRNKISKAEQAKLGRLKVALAGLSVGNAVATTLALEGVFGELRMADFDTLDLSNMNRIRCAVHHIGLHKAVISARQIFEQNPYANLVLFKDGVTADNLGEFLDGDGTSGRADVVIDECDGMYIKIKLREEARARRMPVVMETSDRGMLDIERFDLEPDRPILHGLLGGLTAEEVANLSPPARIRLILDIVGVDTMSPRLAASMLEFGRTLRGLSQLGSDVTLGGATTTSVIRRFGLGMPLPSGRLFIDVSSMLAEVRSPEGSQASEAEAKARRELAEVRRLVEAAVLAPSDGNRQPWRFGYDPRDRTLRVYHDHARTGGPGDEFGRQMAWIAIGAALENMSITANNARKSAAIKLFPTAGDLDLVATVTLVPHDGGEDDPLAEQIAARCTNRRPGTRPNLTPVHAQVLTSAARDRGARLQLCTNRDTLVELGKILGEAERLRMLSPTLHADLFSAIRWSDKEAEETRDGVALDTWVTNDGEASNLRLTRSTHVTKLLRDVDGGQGLAGSIGMAIASSAAVGLLTISGTGPSAFVLGGRAMQQVWLTASALGIATHPINNLVAMLARVERYHGAGLNKHEIRAIIDLREQFTRCFSVSMNDAEVLLFRFSYADAPASRTLRRQVDDVFTVLPGR